MSENRKEEKQKRREEKKEKRRAEKEGEASESSQASSTSSVDGFLLGLDRNEIKKKIEGVLKENIDLDDLNLKSLASKVLENIETVKGTVTKTISEKVEEVEGNVQEQVGRIRQARDAARDKLERARDKIRGRKPRRSKD